MGGSPNRLHRVREMSVSTTRPLFLMLTDMESELNQFIKKGNELLLKLSDNNETKRKILINRAKKSIDTFEIVMNKLIQ